MLTLAKESFVFRVFHINFVSVHVYVNNQWSAGNFDKHQTRVDFSCQW